MTIKDYPILKYVDNNELTRGIYYMLDHSGYSEESITDIEKSFKFFAGKEININHISLEMLNALEITSNFILDRTRYSRFVIWNSYHWICNPTKASHTRFIMQNPLPSIFPAKKVAVSKAKTTLGKQNKILQRKGFIGFLQSFVPFVVKNIALRSM